MGPNLAVGRVDALERERPRGVGTIAAGQSLLDELVDHATQERFVYTHVWTDDDVILWDNRCAMHSVQPFDNVRIRRILHRVTLVGDGPSIAATRDREE